MQNPVLVLSDQQVTFDYLHPHLSQMARSRPHFAPVRVAGSCHRATNLRA
ncbi:MAG: hypothetical protein GVY04_00535 [Cyanobacteria bacterium]|nr:hypothetical protein [Cyanobacteria bacterium GSL.Bin1]